MHLGTNLVEGDVDVGISGSLDNVGELDNFLCGNVKIVMSEDTKARFSDLLSAFELVNPFITPRQIPYQTYQLLGLINLGTLQSNNQRDLHIKLLGSCNDTFSNDITSHDTTKDVDECGGDLNCCVCVS